jgi:acyl-coenzyme A thioesterase PaaI-like protein
MAHAPRLDDWPSVEARVRASFARQGLMGHLGARLVAVGKGTCAIACAPRPELSQQHGFVHAGVIAAIADSAAGYAALAIAPEGSEVLTEKAHPPGNDRAIREGTALFARMT